MTRARPDELSRAIGGFVGQSHANKELVVVHERDDDATLRLLASIETRCRTRQSEAMTPSGVTATGPNPTALRTIATPAGPIVVACVEADRNNTLGGLRNTALDLARGDFVCQWDDDDLYNPRRVELQLEALARTGKGACLLERWLIHDLQNDTVYVSLKRDSGWEGSLLCRRSDVPRYPHLRRGEDTPGVEQLHARGAVVLLDRPELYVYRLHGRNTWCTNHFRAILDRSAPQPQAAAEEVKRLAARHMELFRGSVALAGTS